MLKHLSEFQFYLLCGIILALLTCAVFLHHTCTDSTLLSSTDSLARLLGLEKGGDPTDWKSVQTPAKRYRILFRAVVTGTATFWGEDISPTVFYGIFIAWTSLLTFLCALSFSALIRICGFSRAYGLAGGIIFLLSFPILFAYNYPIFSREDILLYLLVIWGLIAIIKQRYIGIIIISVLAVLTRETGLIIALVMLTDRRIGLKWRILTALPALITPVILRLIIENAPYNPFAGFWRNLKLPLESIFFLLMTFGCAWLGGFLGKFEYHKSGDSQSNSAINLMASSFPWAVGAISVSAVCFSILRENRITFVAFPWILIFFLDWVKTNHLSIKQALKHKIIISIIGVATLLAIVFSNLLLSNPDTLTRNNLIGPMVSGIIRSHTTLSKILQTYPDIIWWATLFITNCSLTVFILTVIIVRKRNLHTTRMAG